MIKYSTIHNLKRRWYKCQKCGHEREFETLHSGIIYRGCQVCKTRISVHHSIEKYEPDAITPTPWDILPGATVEGVKESPYFKGLVAEICRDYKVEQKQIFAKVKVRNIAEARQLLAYNLRFRGFTLQVCGDLANIAHCSVLHSCREIETRIQTKQLLK